MDKEKKELTLLERKSEARNRIARAFSHMPYLGGSGVYFDQGASELVQLEQLANGLEMLAKIIFANVEASNKAKAEARADRSMIEGFGLLLNRARDLAQPFDLMGQMARVVDAHDKGQPEDMEQAIELCKGLLAPRH